MNAVFIRLYLENCYSVGGLTLGGGEGGWG